MRGETLRNVAIVVGLAAVVAFVPEGDDTAQFVGNVVGVLITIMFLLLGMRLYQMFRGDIHGLGDRWRGILYGAVGLLVLAMAARGRLFDTDLGIVAWFALMAGGSYALYATWRHHRAYRI